MQTYPDSQKVTMSSTQPTTVRADAELIYIAIKQKAVIGVAVAWVVLGLTPMWPAIAGPL